MAAAQLAGEDFLVGLDRQRADVAGKVLAPVAGLCSTTAAEARAPVDALLALAEVFAVLELTPWSVGRSVNPEGNPDSGVRNLPFGTAGMVTHLIVEHERRVDILLVTWAGLS